MLNQTLLASMSVALPSQTLLASMSAALSNQKLMADVDAVLSKQKLIAGLKAEIMSSRTDLSATTDRPAELPSVPHGLDSQDKNAMLRRAAYVALLFVLLVLVKAAAEDETADWLANKAFVVTSLMVIAVPLISQIWPSD